MMNLPELIWEDKKDINQFDDNSYRNHKSITQKQTEASVLCCLQILSWKTWKHKFKRKMLWVDRSASWGIHKLDCITEKKGLTLQLKKIEEINASIPISFSGKEPEIKEFINRYGILVTSKQNVTFYANIIGSGLHLF